RIGDPEGAPCGRADEQVEAKDVCAERFGWNQPEVHVAGRGNSGRIGQRLDGGTAADLPALGKRGFAVCHGRPDDLDAGIAPRLALALLVALPHLADAQARDVRDASVDGNQLAVVAAEPAERTRDMRWIEDAHFAARLDERREESEQRAEDTRPEPVVD